MSLRTSKPQFKLILPTSISSYRLAFRTRCQNPQNIFTTSASRLVTTDSSSLSKVPPVSKLGVPTKPSSIAVPRGLIPDASEIRETKRNQLAQNLIRNGKVLLFQAASHTGFMCMAWIGGVTCFAGTLMILNQRLYEANKELPWFVPSIYRVVAVFLVALSGWSISRSSRLISSIEILPGKDKARLLLKVRRNIPLPFIKPKKMTVHASDVSFQRRVVAALGRPPNDAANLDKGFMTGIASGISATLYRFFAGSRQFILSDGIIKVSVKGHGGIWKLDANGLFLDGGGPLFELVKIKD